MTYSPKKTGFLRRLLRSRAVWTGLAVVAVVPLILVAVEFSRWNRFPRVAVPGTSTPAAASTAEVQQAQEELATWLAQNRVMGLSLCIGTAGSLDWCTAAGHADIQGDIPLTNDSSMRLGSVSKPVTSILLARLADRGIVDLDQPIGELKPDLPPHVHSVTLRQLASHTAGVRHYRWRLGWPPHETASRVAYPTVTDSLSVFVEDPLLFPPGSAFTYSSHGYTLIGAVLETVTGLTFGEILQREIGGPLGLDSLGLDGPDYEAGWARPYEVKGKWYRDALAVDNSRAWPGAGLRASAEDLARLIGGLGHRGLMDESTLKAMLTPQDLPDGSPNEQNYALGWRLAQTREFLGGRERYRVAHHGGVTSGGSAFVLFFPDSSVAVTVLANSRIGSGPLSDLAFAVAEPFMAKTVAGG